jgi:hypothetical protein
MILISSQIILINNYYNLINSEVYYRTEMPYLSDMAFLRSDIYYNLINSEVNHIIEMPYLTDMASLRSDIYYNLINSKLYHRIEMPYPEDMVYQTLNIFLYPCKNIFWKKGIKLVFLKLTIPIINDEIVKKYIYCYSCVCRNLKAA